MIEKLKDLKFCNWQPTFDDIESLTTLEMVAKLYSKLNEIITETNNFEKTIDGKVEFVDDSIKEMYEILRNNLVSALHDLLEEIKGDGTLSTEILNVFNETLSKVREHDEKLGLHDTKIEQLENEFTELSNELEIVRNNFTSGMFRKFMGLTGSVWNLWKQVKNINERSVCKVTEIDGNGCTITCGASPNQRKLRFYFDITNSACYTVTRLQNCRIDYRSTTVAVGLPEFVTLRIDGKTYDNIAPLKEVGFTFNQMFLKIRYEIEGSVTYCTKILVINADEYDMMEVVPASAGGYTSDVGFITGDLINQVARLGQTRVFVMTDEGTKIFYESYEQHGNAVTRRFKFRGL